MKICSYCHAPMPRDKRIKRGVSHGLCEKCAPKLEEAAKWNESQIKQCPSCVRNIGAWLQRCAPCEAGK